MMVPLDTIIFVLRYFEWFSEESKFHKKIVRLFIVREHDTMHRPLYFQWREKEHFNETIKQKEETETTKSN